MMRYAVQVDGAPQTVPAGATAFSVLRNHPTPNTDYTIDDVVINIGRPLTVREEDLLDLLHAIHIADLICARGRNENWQRDISLAVRLREPLRREWFFEQRNGNCRLMASFASHLAETSSTWAQRVAPIAEWVAGNVSASFSQSRRLGSPTLLTQQHRREAKGALPRRPEEPPEPPRICRSCGVELRRGERCPGCGWASVANQPNRIPTRPSAVVRRQAVTSRRLASADAAWNPSDQPTWLTEQVYQEQIQPRLDRVSAARIAAALGVSKPFGVNIRAGRRRPHPRHWRVLAELAGVI